MHHDALLWNQGLQKHCLYVSSMSAGMTQVIRMLRLSSQHVPRYQQLDVKAKQEGFGTVFRSPTVWEDLVKSILLCNCG